MANEIQRWSPIENRIAELRHCQLIRRRNETVQTTEEWFREVLAPLPPLGEVVDLLRVCAVHDRPYLARYIKGADGLYYLSQTIQITKRSHRDQYQRTPAGILVSSRDIVGEESCAWCRARGEEVGGSRSVLCGSCKAEICYGRTTADGYFRCRPSCGSEGPLGQPSHRPQPGYQPEIREGF
jgi:hypothetical protein